MSGIRQVERSIGIPLDFRQKFSADSLPNSMFLGESAYVMGRFKEFCSNVETVCHKRRSAFKKPPICVFDAAIENLCLDFSRKTSLIKVELRKSPSYSLLFTRLSAIPHDVQNARQFYNAEIPDMTEPEPEAEGVLMGVTNYEEPATVLPPPVVPTVIRGPRIRVTRQPSATVREPRAVSFEEPTQNVPLVASYAVGDPIGAANPGHQQTSMISSHETRAHQDPTDQQSLNNNPILRRMQQLESIRGFMSEQEYEEKRKDIINSI